MGAQPSSSPRGASQHLNAAAATAATAATVLGAVKICQGHVSANPNPRTIGHHELQEKEAGIFRISQILHELT